MISLTGKEIKELAEYAGFSVEVEDEDYLEKEFYVGRCPVKGVLDDDGVTIRHYRHVVTCDGCEPNECHPLSDEIKSSTILTDKEQQTMNKAFKTNKLTNKALSKSGRACNKALNLYINKLRNSK